MLEIKELESAELFNSETSHSYKIELGAVICDTPARAFVKCSKSHNSYICCERCTQHGDWYHKIILPDLFASHRTDSSFFQRNILPPPPPSSCWYFTFDRVEYWDDHWFSVSLHGFSLFRCCKVTYKFVTTWTIHLLVIANYSFR